MANHRKDITGEKFGMLTAVKPSYRDEHGRWVWLFTCECGNEVERKLGMMVKAQKDKKKSHCGCSPALKTHGLSKQYQKLNWVWKAMKQRCTNPSCKDFPHYGARGIKVCEQWSEFSTFHSWAISTGYREGLTIERKDVNGDYDPSNCTWIGNEYQSRNRTDTVSFFYDGKQRDIRELSEISGIDYHTLKGRLTQYGWDVERAMTEVAFKGKNQTYARNK